MDRQTGKERETRRQKKKETDIQEKRKKQGDRETDRHPVPVGGFFI